MKKVFEGSMVAIVTPFRDDKVDEPALKNLIEWHIKAGTDAIVPCGTTGESATLSMEEHERVVEFTVEVVAGRVPVIAGTGSNSTAEALRLTKHAEKCGADASLQVTPYYNKPTQDGIYEHFRKIAENTSLPIILYNIQSRTGVNIQPETMARLAEIENIVGVKEASGSLSQMSEIVHLCGDKLTLISGDDGLTLPVFAIGGKGVISVSANVAPEDNAQLWDAWKAGNYEKAKQLFYKLLPLNKAMFIETNPIPVKSALYLMGKIGPEIRLPLTPMRGANLEKLRKALIEYGLLKNAGAK
jgi:4-hydroxy-tetrahydrodipicolinate synthase